MSKTIVADKTAAHWSPRRHPALALFGLGAVLALSATPTAMTTTIHSSAIAMSCVVHHSSFCPASSTTAAAPAAAPATAVTR